MYPGTISSVGTHSLCGQRHNEKAHSVELLERAGAIPFVKSNVPELAFSYHSSNKVFGTGENPWGRDRTVGGSSGGEAGLVAANFTPMGIGSDLGGSIRVPAHFNGITALMPTQRRISLYGLTPYTQVDHCFIDGSVVCIGPMSRTVSDCKLMFEAMTAKHDLSTVIPQVPFREEEFRLPREKAMKIGVWRGLDEIAGICPTI